MTSLRQRLLNKEAELIINNFLRQFPGTRRSLELTDNTLLIRAFPLPDDYRPDYVDLLMVTWGYPDAPSAAHQAIKNAFSGTVNFQT